MAQENIVGCLLGTAVGDALGLPYEGLSPRRAARMLGHPDRYRLVSRYGMFSDDTEHTCMVAQALVESAGNPEVFGKDFSWRLRWWLLGLPAGVGFATLRATIKLWLGFDSKNSGVFSAGNGPAMRAGIFGAAIDDLNLLRRFVRISTRMTHTDPKAEYGAFAIALAAQMARMNGTVAGAEYLDRLIASLEPSARELFDIVSLVVHSVEIKESTADFARSIGLSRGVSGYVYHTVPVALHAWLQNQGDFRAALHAAIVCGGDADTVAAIVGAIVGASVGKAGIPQAWLTNLIDWPRSAAWIEQLGHQLHKTMTDGRNERPYSLPLAGIMLRNALFVVVVLFHGFRRMLPPY